MRAPVADGLPQGSVVEMTTARDPAPASAPSADGSTTPASPALNWKSPRSPYMARFMTAAMPIPGHIDPVPVPRPSVAADDARVDLVGLSRAEIRDALIEAGLDERQAKLRAKQIWHQIYNRGATRLRGDERHRQAAARLARRALRRSAGPRW